MNSVVDYYHKILAKADGRVSDWLLMGSPFPTLALVTLYLLAVHRGQKWMKNYAPFDLKSAIIVYNSLLVALSLYMMYEFIMSSWTAPEFKLSCQAVDYSDNLNAVRLAKACWLFYFSKVIELMDTMFFVLRKKNNQITFLHVYHHSTMPLLWWMGVKFIGGGEAYFSASINSGVHALMYLYYMLSAMGPAVQPYLWWKKYLTTLQLVQFWLVLFKTMYMVYARCGFPVEHGYILIGYMISHIILFSNFYYKTYNTQALNKKEE